MELPRKEKGHKYSAEYLSIGSAKSYCSKLEKKDRIAVMELLRVIKRLVKGDKLQPEKFKSHTTYKNIHYVKAHQGSGHRLFCFLHNTTYYFTHGVKGSETKGRKYDIQGKRAENLRQNFLSTKNGKNNENS